MAHSKIRNGDNDDLLGKSRDRGGLDFRDGAHLNLREDPGPYYSSHFGWANWDEPGVFEACRREQCRYCEELAPAEVSTMTVQALVRVSAWALGCAILILLVTYLFSGCASGPTPAQQLDVAEYQAEQLECIQTHDTRASIDACRNAVKARHGRLDAGQ